MSLTKSPFVIWLNNLCHHTITIFLPSVKFTLLMMFIFELELLHSNEEEQIQWPQFCIEMPEEKKRGKEKWFYFWRPKCEPDQLLWLSNNVNTNGSLSLIQGCVGASPTSHPFPFSSPPSLLIIIFKTHFGDNDEFIQ